MFTFTVRKTKQIKLFHTVFSQGISKVTALKATCIALCQSSAWLKVSPFMLFCPQGWRGGGMGASSPSSCTTGLKPMQNNSAWLQDLFSRYPCSHSQEPLGWVRNVQLQLRVCSSPGNKLQLLVNFRKMFEEVCKQDCVEQNVRGHQFQL